MYVVYVQRIVNARLGIKNLIFNFLFVDSQFTSLEIWRDTNLLVEENEGALGLTFPVLFIEQTITF